MPRPDDTNDTNDTINMSFDFSLAANIRNQMIIKLLETFLLSSNFKSLLY